MDLESKLSFTNPTDINVTSVDEEILKSGLILPNNQFKSIDEREEFGKPKIQRKGSIVVNSTEKAKKLSNNFPKKGQGSEQQPQQH